MKNWIPSSPQLRFHEGIWLPRGPISPISYPEQANDFFSEIETTSFWFHHRNDCVLAMVRQYAPQGMFYDIGGGNGWVSLALERNGIPTVLVEPGHGVHHARRRGLPRIVQSSLATAGFDHETLPAAGCFDVIEHISDEVDFCRLIHDLLQPGGHLFCTVPAGPWLWSEEDEAAGHCRRYTAAQLSKLLEQTGFQVIFLSHIFSWMSFPLFLGRTLPGWLSGRKKDGLSVNRKTAQDHHLPDWLRPLVSSFHRWELDRLESGRSVPWGTSILAVARKEQGDSHGCLGPTGGQTK